MWRITWRRRAYNQFAKIVRDHPFATVVLAAAQRDLSAGLSAAADSAGESRAGNVRFACYGPLGVYFRASPADRAARVLSLHLTHPPAGP